jgi:hypothetical protein
MLYTESSSPKILLRLHLSYEHPVRLDTRINQKAFRVKEKEKSGTGHHTAGPPQVPPVQEACSGGFDNGWIFP